jgi:hypothetical protein
MPETIHLCFSTRPGCIPILSGISPDKMNRSPYIQKYQNNYIKPIKGPVWMQMKFGVHFSRMMPFRVSGKISADVGCKEWDSNSTY